MLIILIGVFTINYGQMALRKIKELTK